MKVKYPVFLVIIIGFILILILDKSSRKDDGERLLVKEDSMNVEVYKTYVNHAIVEINNSKLIPPSTYKNSTTPKWLHRESKGVEVYDISPPFKILKEKNSFEFLIIKKEDTLIFELPDPQYKNPNDPTFKEFFDRYFN